jgi:hypothetical protein
VTARSPALHFTPHFQAQNLLRPPSSVPVKNFRRFLFGLILLTSCVIGSTQNTVVVVELFDL